MEEPIGKYRAPKPDVELKQGGVPPWHPSDDGMEGDKADAWMEKPGPRYTAPDGRPMVGEQEFAKGGKVQKVMHEFGAGKLHSGSKKGPVVTSRQQAIAIGISEARKAGEHVPRKRSK